MWPLPSVHSSTIATPFLKCARAIVNLNLRPTLSPRCHNQAEVHRSVRVASDALASPLRPLANHALCTPFPTTCSSSRAFAYFVIHHSPYLRQDNPEPNDQDRRLLYSSLASPHRATTPCANGCHPLLLRPPLDGVAKAPACMQRLRLGVGGAKALTKMGTMGMFQLGVKYDCGTTSA